MIPEAIAIAPVFPPWLIAIFGGLAGVFLFIQYRWVRRRLARSQATKISLLRLGAFFLLILVALNPVVSERKEHPIRPTVAVLLDTSPSMGFPGGRGQGSRLDEARELLFSGRKPLQASLAEKFDVRLYALHESLGVVEVKDLSSLKPGQVRGGLAKGLEALASRHTLVILLSDGNLQGEKDPTIKLPLITVPVGDPEGYRDILLAGLKAPPMAFRGREVTIEAAIRSYGYEGFDLPVLLKEGPKLLKAKRIRLPKGRGEINVSFPLLLEEVGEHNLTVLIPPQPEESTEENNRVDFSLQVVRDKIRILMVSGTPSMNYRHLRIAFKNDPTIDLLSFVILRTPRDIINVPLNEQSLIPFPVDTLFSKELGNFDLLVFDNFLYSLFLRTHHLESIRDFVKKGGALALIGGPNFIEGGMNGGSPIDEILPAKFFGKESYRRGSPSGVALTRAGRTHPLTRLSPIAEENLRIWREMPPLDGINPIEAKGSAVTLLEKEERFGQPLLVVGRYGHGRTLILATDESWKWYAGMVAKREGNWAYLRFMERLVRWLTKDPGLEPVQFAPPGEEAFPGVKKEIKIQLREEDFSPSERGKVRMSVLNPKGAKIESQLKPSGKQGEYLGSFLPDQEGPYKVRVETDEGSWERSVLIARPAENKDAAPDHERLKRIAEAVGGKALSRAEEVLNEAEAIAGKREKHFVEERSAPLWAHSAVLALIVFLLCAEWYWRRKWGLV